MLGLILFVLVFYILCWCYTRVQMYVWYGPDSSQSKKSVEDSPLVIETEAETRRQDETASAHGQDARQGA